MNGKEHDYYGLWFFRDFGRPKVHEFNERRIVVLVPVDFLFRLFGYGFDVHG